MTEEITIDSATAGEGPFAGIATKLVAAGEDNESEAGAEGRVAVPLGFHTVVSASLAQNFAGLLPKSVLVECVAWAWEGNVLRVWTVLSRRDRDVQQRIYRAESHFLDAFPDRLCDFSIVFREDRALQEVLPTKARLLTFAD